MAWGMVGVGILCGTWMWISRIGTLLLCAGFLVAGHTRSFDFSFVSSLVISIWQFLTFSFFGSNAVWEEFLKFVDFL